MTRKITFEYTDDQRRHASTCTGPNCGQPIVWLVTHSEDGKASKMPVDVVGAERGLDGLWRGVSHFATCPDAKRFRRKK